MYDLRNLSEVIEKETALGEELLHNLAAQREAILSWDICALLSRIEEKEAELRSLGALEECREHIVEELCGSAEKTPSLQEILHEPPFRPETARLASLRLRAQEIYTRLRLEERRLQGLMETLLTHLQEALRTLSQPAVHLYAQKGVADLQRPSSGFIQGKV